MAEGCGGAAHGPVHTKKIQTSVKIIPIYGILWLLK